MDFNGVRGKRKDGTPAQMTPWDIFKKSVEDVAAKPALSCLHCVCVPERETASNPRQGISTVMERWHRRMSTNFQEIIYDVGMGRGKWAVLLKHGRFSRFEHLVPGGYF